MNININPNDWDIISKYLGISLTDDIANEICNALPSPNVSNRSKEQIEQFIEEVRLFSCNHYNYSYEEGVNEITNIKNKYSGLISNLGKSDPIIHVQICSLECMLIDLAIYNNIQENIIEKHFFCLIQSANYTCFDMVITTGILIAQHFLHSRETLMAKKYYRLVFLIIHNLHDTLPEYIKLIRCNIEQLNNLV